MKRLLRQRLRHKVILCLKSGESFSGVLFDADRESVILREASLLGAGERGSNVVVDGELLVLRSDVSYLQLP